jgi:hypothetical protein
MTSHDVEIQRRADPRKGLFPGLSQYRAVCSCGWETHWRNYESQAETEATAHDAAGGRPGAPPTGA